MVSHRHDFDQDPPQSKGTRLQIEGRRSARGPMTGVVVCHVPNLSG